MSSTIQNIDGGFDDERRSFTSSSHDSKYCLSRADVQLFHLHLMTRHCECLACGELTGVFHHRLRVENQPCATACAETYLQAVIVLRMSRYVHLSARLFGHSSLLFISSPTPQRVERCHYFISPGRHKAAVGVFVTTTPSFASSITILWSPILPLPASCWWRLNRSVGTFSENEHCR